MFLLLIERDLVPQVDDVPIDSSAYIAGSPHVEQFFAILALPTAHDRRDNLKLGSFREGEKGIHHLLDSLCGNFIATVEAEGVADTGEQQSKVVVDFSDGPDGRSRVVTRALLLY